MIFFFFVLFKKKKKLWRILEINERVLLKNSISSVHHRPSSVGTKIRHVEALWNKKQIHESASVYHN